ncbi:unnamed protein product [Arctogadus glacialis]
MMKSHHVGLLLLLVNAPTASRQNRSPADQYQDFKLKHFNLGMRITECDSVILTRNIIDTITYRCKPTNTFITAPLSQIVAICRGHNYGIVTSNNPLTFVMCRLTNGAVHPSPPNCQYQGTSFPIAKRPTVTCNGQFPVHFNGYV